MDTKQIEVVDLQWEWEKDIAPILARIPGVKTGPLAKYVKEGSGLPGKHFFAVEYNPGAIIMARGTKSDYAAIHLSGRIFWQDRDVPMRGTGPGCWDRPLLRRLENLVLNVRDRSTAPVADKSSAKRRLLAPLLGKLYLSCPGLPLWLVDVARRWLPTWGGKQRVQQQTERYERWASKLEEHIASVVAGQIESVPRAERILAGPVPQYEEGAVGDRWKPSEAACVIGIFDNDGNEKPVMNRFLGITGAIWNQPRSVTLVAADPAEDGPCRVLLIKRKALLEMFDSKDTFTKREKELGDHKKEPTPGQKLLADKLRDFVRTTLPTILAKNRLFRDMLYEDDVLDWKQLLEYLKGTRQAGGPRQSNLWRHIRDLLEADFRTWLRDIQPDAPLAAEGDRRRILNNLNKVLADRALAPADLQAADFPDEISVREAEGLLQQEPDARSDCERYRLNRLLVAKAAGDALKAGPTPWPLFRDEFIQVTAELSDTHAELGLGALEPELWKLTPEERQASEDKFVFEEGQISEDLFLILSGMVQVVRKLPGGKAVVNNLDSGGYFGETALLDEETAAPASSQGGPQIIELPRRAGSVKLLSSCYLLAIPRAVFKKLEKRDHYAWLKRKLTHERDQVRSRNKLYGEGWLLPPRDPPPAVADRLVLTRNLLIIDMDRCTRCDQCVRGCAEAHEGQPRFHRANPELRFGKWEVARACMNCMDAPCLEACPVGAITFLDSKAVQIHRTRCIGCSNCAEECPFGVIDMYQPTSSQDAPSLKKQVTAVANKCDLCLTESRDPPCVVSCPYDAARRVDPVEFFRGLRGRGLFAE